MAIDESGQLCDDRLRADGRFCPQVPLPAGGGVPDEADGAVVPQVPSLPAWTQTANGADGASPAFVAVKVTVPSVASVIVAKPFAPVLAVAPPPDTVAPAAG